MIAGETYTERYIAAVDAGMQNPHWAAMDRAERRRVFRLLREHEPWILQLRRHDVRDWIYGRCAPIAPSKVSDYHVILNYSGALRRGQ